MAVEVIMPKVDMDQETGTVLEWLKREGQEVRQGEPLLVIETDKVSIDVEAPGDGILGGVRALPGDVIPVGEVIAYLLGQDEEVPPAPAPEGEPLGLPDGKTAPAASEEEDKSPATPLARRLADSSGIDLAGIAGSGRGGKIHRSDVLRHQDAASAGSGVVRATPAARRAAGDTGLDLGAVSGSGPRGRVQEADVHAALEQEGQGAGAGPVLEARRIPLVGMRRRIAERLTASYQEIPHVTFTSRVDMSGFNQARLRLNERAESRGQSRISATALMVKIVGRALQDYPVLNASLQGDEILIWNQINIGVAVALADGLIVPVIREADRKGINDLAGELEALTERARQGQLSLDEVRDGTFTLSNLGPFGIEEFTAIINPPQSGILAVGAAQDEIVPGEGGEAVVRPILRMTLSADHRIVDGAVAAQFMRDLKALFEAPILLLSG